MAVILDGKAVNQQILTELRPRIARLAAERRPPGLAVILVGNDPSSEIYVSGKVRTCRDLGMRSEEIRLPATTTTEALLERISELNADPGIDGVLVQIPLPPGIDARTVLLAIDPAKDVDGLHPFNVGNLVANRPGPRPCTPAGIMELLRRHDIPVKGKRAVVVGRSDIVGKPMAMLLLHQHATVTLCHSRTVDLAGECRRAEILVAVIGKTALVTEDYIADGAVVIDVGINRVSDRALAAELTGNDPKRMAGFDKAGSIVIGDVHPLAAARKASAYTPVPGGVGPLTIAMLMANTVESAERRLGLG
jgi:methylenetetrahydrofolate dehydrogenase (NADP+)/methenyltetrahydrofolate cyclohydrolase